MNNKKYRITTTNLFSSRNEKSYRFYPDDGFLLILRMERFHWLEFLMEDYLNEEKA